jgi:hypothetical protein
VDQGLHGVITLQLPVHKLHVLLANLKGLYERSLALLFPWGFQLSTLPSEVEK